MPRAGLKYGSWGRKMGEEYTRDVTEREALALTIEMFKQMKVERDKLLERIEIIEKALAMACEETAFLTPKDFIGWAAEELGK